jgi:NAD(P)-dependent dehydrogenase (short-subunit alcohol dehydrogenase family)
MANILIIGASSGIGESLTKILSKDIHTIYGSYLKTNVSNSLNVHYFKYDVLEEESSLPELPEIIDGVVYCPGSINLKPFERITLESFREDYELQVLGAVKVLQQVLPKLKKSDNASVVLFSSVAAGLGFGFHAQVSLAKGAIEGLTKALSAEYAPKVRFNCIAPSLTNTPLASKLLSSEEKITANGERHPMKRVGTPEDIAETAAFLLSNKSSWITGQIFHIDGGMSSIK